MSGNVRRRPRSDNDLESGSMEDIIPNIPNIYLRRPTVPDASFNNSILLNDSSKEQKDVPKSRNFRRPSLKLLPSVAAIDQNSDTENDESRI